MSTLHCFDCQFTIKGPPEFESLLRAKGFEISKAVEGTESLTEFRLEPKGRHYDLYQGESRISNEQTLALLCEMVTSRIHLLVSAHCEDYTFLRADVVQAPKGEALLLAGSTFTGKTRMAQTLIRAGAQAWSQHYAVLDQSGAVLPYPRPEKPKEGLKLGAVVKVAYQPGSEWEVQTSTPGQATLHLVPLVVGGENAVPKALPRLSAAVTLASVHLSGQRGAAEQAVEALASSAAW